MNADERRIKQGFLWALTRRCIDKAATIPDVVAVLEVRGLHTLANHVFSVSGFCRDDAVKEIRWHSLYRAGRAAVAPPPERRRLNQESRALEWAAERMLATPAGLGVKRPPAQLDLVDGAGGSIASSRSKRFYRSPQRRKFM